MATRILVADDHVVVREGLAAMLSAEENLDVVGKAGDTGEALALVLEKAPDLVIMDISMPHAGGIAATRRIKELAPDVAVLILTVHEDRELMQEAIRAGASGYVLKRAIRADLIHAVDTVMRGQLYLHPVMARMLLEEGPQPTSSAPTPSAPMEPPDERLTPREIEVLQLIAQGYTNRQAATQLELSVRTVEYHRRNLTTKLGMNGRVELMRYAEEHGLL